MVEASAFQKRSCGFEIDLSMIPAARLQSWFAQCREHASTTSFSSEEAAADPCSTRRPSTYTPPKTQAPTVSVLRRPSRPPTQSTNSRREACVRGALLPLSESADALRCAAAATAVIFESMRGLMAPTGQRRAAGGPSSSIGVASRTRAEGGQPADASQEWGEPLPGPRI
jgi:hypothetical protein